MGQRNDFFTLDINPRIVENVRKGQLRNFLQVLTLSTSDLVRLTKLSFSDVSQLQNATAAALYPFSPITALQITNKNCPVVLQKYLLSTGCNVLDNFLKEGIMSGVLTEISGESATGKTQLCLQLCLTVQLSTDWGGLDGKAVYVSTEDVFPSTRIADMSSRLKERFTEFESINFLDNVYVERAVEFDDLKFCLSHKIPYLVSEKNAKLVVIDSVAAIMRSERLDKESLHVRNKKLKCIISLLHGICSQHNVPVVLINQVTDDFTNTSITGRSTKKVPALGMAWAAMMNIRIALSRTKEYMTVGELRKIEANIRLMEVLSAPHIPNIFCRFIVDEDGVKGIKSL